jgi:hypothetical protein
LGSPFGVTTDPIDPELFRRIAREYARSASELPLVRGVFLICRRSSALIWTVIDGEPHDWSARETVFARQAATRAAYPEMSLDFTTVNPREWPDEVRVEIVPSGAERIWRRGE